MPAINFNSRFADDVEAGRKRRTIRGRYIKPGEPLYFFTGQRTKTCRRLGEAVCRTCEPVMIGRDARLASGYWVKLNGMMLTSQEADRFAAVDGFESMADMVAFLSKRRGGLPMSGWVTTW